MQRASVVLSIVLVVGTVGGVATAGLVEGTAAQSAECEYPVSETDATGETVTLEEEPESVVTLNPSAAQMLWEMGAEEKVTGVTKHAMNLEGASERTNISNEGQTISHEIVVDLDPDLVLVPLSRVATEEDVETLREAGLTVFAYPTADSIDEVRERTLLTGQLVGECEGATETVEWMDEQLSIVEEAVEDEERPDVLYTFFGFTAGEGTHIHEILEAAGSNNIAAAVGIEEYQPVNEEIVVEENPDWIVLNSDTPEVPDGDGFEQTTAIQENQTVVIDTNHLNRPGPRIIYAITELASTFHPDAYAAAVEEAESTPTPTPEANETSEDEATPTPTETPAPETDDDDDSTPAESPDDADDDGAGFGVVAVVGALLGLALVAAGRNSRMGARR